MGGEIVGCDAVQVYRGLDAATAKPTPAERGRVEHHLVDHVDPRRDYSLADFVAEADAAIAGIVERRRTPLVVGGTGMYLRGLLRGVVSAPARDQRLRERLRGLIERRGSARVHRWLVRLDPDSADRVAPADRQRLVRALELALGHGPSWSERLRLGGTWRTSDERYHALKIALDIDRDRLAERLDGRVVDFFAAGLVDEVRLLLAQGVPPDANALKAIGYRQVVEALRDGRDPSTAIEPTRRATRRYAKRQRSWFRGEPGVVWLDADWPVGRLVERVLELWRAGVESP